MHKINYTTKNTQATTIYVQLEDEDRELLIQSLMAINFYMGELSISPDKEIRDFTKWYITPNKKYPYNSKLKKNNSPQSLISGVLSNLLFGTQRDFSLTQLDLVQEISNTAVDIIEVIKDEKTISLQENPKYLKIWCQENLWNN
jgi:hypothetical protein